jgi:glucokinase
VQTRQQAPAEPVLGLDLGGSSVKWVRMDGGAVTASGRVPTPRTGVDDVLAALVGVVAAQPRVRSVGLAAAAIIDAAGGRLLVVPNIPGEWAGRAIGAELADGTGRPVALVNDARAFAWGQLRHGAAAGARDAVFITLGTGVGGGIASDGRLRLGHLNRGGEIGHVPVEPDDGRKCGCGAVGCLETVAGGRALAELGADLVREGRAPALAAAVGGRAREVTAGHVVAAADADPACGRLVARAGRALGLVLAGLASTLAPEIIVIGGGMAAALPAFRPHLTDALERHALLPAAPRIVAALDDHAGAVGAAAWARQAPDGYPAAAKPNGSHHP